MEESSYIDDKLQDLFGDLPVNFESLGDRFRLNKYGSFMSVVLKVPYKKIAEKADDLKGIEDNGKPSTSFSEENPTTGSRTLPPLMSPSNDVSRAADDKIAKGVRDKDKPPPGLSEENAGGRQCSHATGPRTMQPPGPPSNDVSSAADEIAKVQTGDNLKGNQDNGKSSMGFLKENARARQCSHTTGPRTMQPPGPTSNDVSRAADEIAKIQTGDNLKGNQDDDKLPPGFSNENPNAHNCSQTIGPQIMEPLMPRSSDVLRAAVDDKIAKTGGNLKGNQDNDKPPPCVSNENPNAHNCSPTIGSQIMQSLMPPSNDVSRAVDDRVARVRVRPLMPRSNDVSRAADDRVAKTGDNMKGNQDNGKQSLGFLKENPSAHNCSPTTDTEMMQPPMAPSNDVSRAADGKIDTVGRSLKGREANVKLSAGLLKDSTTQHRNGLPPLPPKHNVSTAPDRKLSKAANQGIQDHYMQPTSSSKIKRRLRLASKEDNICAGHSEPLKSLNKLGQGTGKEYNTDVFGKRKAKVVDNEVDMHPKCKVKIMNSGNEKPKESSSGKSEALILETAVAEDVPLIKEDWACCDICNTWRLLPHGTNTKDLPKRWMCKMQFWLPRMKGCNFSQEETEKAFRDLYSVPVENDTNLNGEHGAVASTIERSEKVDRTGKMTKPRWEESQTDQEVQVSSQHAVSKRPVEETADLGRRDSKKQKRAILSSPLEIETEKQHAERRRPVEETADLNRRNLEKQKRAILSSQLKIKDEKRKRPVQETADLGRRDLEKQKRAILSSPSEIETEKPHAIRKRPVEETTDLGRRDLEKQKRAILSSPLEIKTAKQPAVRKRPVEETVDFGRRDLEKQKRAMLSSPSDIKTAKQHATRRRPVEETADLGRRDFAKQKMTILSSPSGIKTGKQHAIGKRPVEETADLGRRGLEKQKRTILSSPLKIKDEKPASRNRPIKEVDVSRKRSDDVVDQTGDLCGINKEASFVQSRYNHKAADKHKLTVSNSSINQEEHLRPKTDGSYGLSDASSGKPNSEKIFHQTSHNNKKYQSEAALRILESDSVMQSKAQQEVHGQGLHAPKDGQSKAAHLNSTNVDTQHMTEKKKEPDKKNATNHSSLRHNTPDVNDFRCPNSNYTPATNIALKEVMDLKDTAKSLEDAELRTESTQVYFQAALKLLHVASLLEQSTPDHIKCKDDSEPIKFYVEAGRLFKSCALSFEKDKKMSVAALAHKCTEVTHFKVAFLKHPIASKDQQELHTVHSAKPGEAASPFVSNVDDFNDAGMLDKPTLANTASLPNPPNKHVISVHLRSTYSRWLENTNQTILGFEASRKAQDAFAAAVSVMGKETAGLSSVKDVLDFDFHNIEELLRLVMLSMESNN